MNQYIAELMCRATVEVMHPLCANIHLGQKIYCRVGSGFATNHRKQTITYGVKMVQDKRQESSARNWTTGKEILKRKYFDKFTYKNLIIATILHEYAHFIQTLTGGRKRNSVHNDAFYKILDDFYANDYHFIVQDFLMNYDDFWNSEFDKPLPIVEKKSLFSKEDLKGVQYIDADFRGEIKTLKILKVNPKKVICTNANGSNTFWFYFSAIKKLHSCKPEFYIETGLGIREHIYTKNSFQLNENVLVSLDCTTLSDAKIKARRKDKALIELVNTRERFLVNYSFIIKK